MKQIHHGKAEQVNRERLLHLDRHRTDSVRDAGKRRKVRIDREGPEHAKASEQDGQRPARGACQMVRASGFTP